MTVVEAVLVGLAVALQLACCAGLVRMRTALDRLHYAGAAAALPPSLVAAAVWVEEGPTQASLDAVAAALLLLVLGPVVTIATARAARGRRTGR